MSDVLSKEQRSYCMSRIKGGDTKPEIALRKALWSLGYRYRIKNKLPGRPDLVFPKNKVVVFIDGCFWHRCPEHYVAPKTRADFWENKISKNVIRDKKNTKELHRLGWKVLRVWEHQIKQDLDHVVDEVIKLL